jgi:small subunit ribosomal protein S18
MRQKPSHAPLKERTCYLCANAIDALDYKDIRGLQRFTSASGKIYPRRRSGACMKHQRVIAEAIKRARIMALLPFTSS